MLEVAVVDAKEVVGELLKQITIGLNARLAIKTLNRLLRDHSGLKAIKELSVKAV